MIIIMLPRGMSSLDLAKIPPFRYPEKGFSRGASEKAASHSMEESHLAVSEGSAPSYVLSGRRLWLSFFAAATGSFMINVDTSVVNVVLPVLSRQFSVSITALQWTVSVYLIVITGIIPLSGKLARRWGMREVFAGGMTLFVIGSLLCAVAPAYPWLILARGFQGIGAAGMMPNQMAIVALTFPQSRRGQGIGLMGASVAAGTLCGPPIGGILTAWLGWRSIFWINLPIGIWGVWASLAFLPRFARTRAYDPLDIRGALIYAVFATLFELGLSMLHRPWGWALMAVSAGSLILFIRQERRHPDPLITLRLFAIRVFRQGVGALTVFWMLLMFPAFLTPLYLKIVAGDPIGVIGFVMLPQAAGMVIASPLGGRLTDRIGSLWPIRAGLALFFLGNLGFFSLSTSSSNWVVMGWLLVIGIGSGLFNSPNNTSILNSVAAKDTATASAIIASQRILARATGVTLAALALSVMWTIVGIGDTLPLNHPRYEHWFLAGFHGAFGVAMALSAVGLVMTAASRTRKVPQPASWPAQD